MSRIGLLPVPVPSGVTVDVVGGIVNVKGKLGAVSFTMSNEVVIEKDGDNVVVKPLSQSKAARMMWGTARALINNMVRGVTEGFSKTLEINGVGYRAAVQGRDVVLTLGYSHEIRYPIPEGIAVKCERPTIIQISGVDRQRVGQVAAELRAMRGPEPYKGKGIRYSTETIRRKEGKKK